MITRDIILELIDNATDPSISIFLPTHKKGEEVQQDPIRFKNLLTEVRNQLSDQNFTEAQIDDLLEEPQKLLDQPIFWQHNDRGLAVFAGKEFFEYYRVPLDFNEQVLVNNHFLITPLLPMITLEGTYCVLALSQKKMRLLKCTRNSVEPIALDEAPTSLEEFLKYDVHETNLQHHSGQGQGNAIFHGHGGASDTDTHEIINYLKQVENEVTSTMKKRNDPLILAGVERAVAEYRKVNGYSRLMDGVITENPDPLSEQEINERAWDIIKGHFLEDMYSSLNKFENLTGSNKHSNSLTQIVEASYYGKVDSLFVPIGEQSWGWFDEEKDTVHHSSKRQNGEHDLINMAAIKTLSQGGNVFALNKSEMPDKTSVAAIFRY